MHSYITAALFAMSQTNKYPRIKAYKKVLWDINTMNITHP